MKIIVGYLASPEGEAALRSAVAEAKTHEAELIVIHSHESREADQDEYELEQQRWHIEQVLGDSQVAYRVEHVRAPGDAADHIVTVARTEQPLMVVVGLRQRSPVGKALLGSTAQTVLLDAPCPVLAVKAPSAGKP
jgi:nucleotide-binding universal stress UspA family protein